MVGTVKRLWAQDYFNVSTDTRSTDQVLRGQTFKKVMTT